MANGLFGGGTGISADPYLVEDAQDLNAVRNNLSAHYKQVADIDMMGWGNWTPIGTSVANFRGNYNGNGHKIDGLYIDSPTTDYVGLFGVVSGGEINNLGMINIKIEGNKNVAGVIGQINNSAKITNCYVIGDITGTDSVASIVGSAAYNSNGVVLNCCASGLVIGKQNIAGIIGVMSGGGRISNCVALHEYIARIQGSTATTFADIKAAGSVEPQGCYSFDTLEFRQL